MLEKLIKNELEERRTLHLFSSEVIVPGKGKRGLGYLQQDFKGLGMLIFLVTFPIAMIKKKKKYPDQKQLTLALRCTPLWLSSPGGRSWGSLSARKQSHELVFSQLPHLYAD